MGLILSKFFAEYGAPLLVGLLAFLYISGLRASNERLREDRAALQGQVAGYVETNETNAAELARLNERLSAKNELASVRLGAEEARRKAAEGRNSRFSGAIDGLRKKIENRDCGVGPALTNSLRINREERESARKSRERSYQRRPTNGVQTSGGFTSTDGTGARTANPTRP